MSPWQKRARLGAATFGIACAIAVYTAMGERVKPAPPAAVTQRIDPRAVIESTGNVLQQVRGTKQDYVIKAAQQLTYQGGATKLLGVEVSVANRGGRDFVITAREAEAGEHQQDLHLTGDVKMRASDGFEVATDRAMFSESDGMVRAPAEFTFMRGRMTGSGVGMTYDKNGDVLSIAEATRVRLTDAMDFTLTEFTATTSMFTRPSHLLTLGGAVHVLHHQQTIEGDNATAYLTEDDNRPTAIELRGSSRVAGSGHGLDSMSARDIDLHYAEDGETLTSVKLTGAAEAALTSQSGGAGRHFLGDSIDIDLGADGTVTGVRGRKNVRLDEAERHFFGDSMDIGLGADGAVTSVRGQDNVRLDLAADQGSPPRNIRARTMEADGDSGGLTRLHFSDEVQFQEGAVGDSPARTARSRALDVSLSGNAVATAVFSGAVKFEEQGLQAAGAQARYEPEKGRLQLSGRDAGGGPHVADDQVTVDADAIDLTIESRSMAAKGTVKTTLRARGNDAGAAAVSSGSPGDRAGGARGTQPGTATRLPGLLKQEQPANVNANALEYQGAAGKAIYTGNATLWQGETAIRADAITVDQSTGDLAASGSARSTIVLDSDTSVGRAAQIRYTDTSRTITYEGTTTVDAQLSGPQGDLRAARIEIVLAPGGGGIARLEAYTHIGLKVDTRVATGARLTYFADDKRYVMTGAAAVPVKVVEGCRETTGKTLTFFKANDRIIVDGNEEIRTHTTGATACPGDHPR